MTYKLAFSTMSMNQKIPPGDDLWSTFNGSFANVELETIDIANQIYTGHPFTTWHKDNWRKSSNYLIGQHLALDFDTEDERSTLPSLLKDKFIARYAALLYTTPNHTPSAPRARVLFLLDTPIQQAKNFVLAITSLLWLFGSTADRQCKDPCRFFYGSTDCDIEYLDNVLPLEKVKDIISQYQTTGLVAKRRQENPYTPTVDEKEVADALRHIPPWTIDYDEWVKVLMGIHSAFGDGGLALAEHWAQGGDGEVARKWRSFSESGNGAGQVTVRTLFKLAQQFGYSKREMMPA